MHRLAAISAVSGALLGLTLATGCDQTGYETTDETETTTPSYDMDTDDTTTTTTPPADTEMEDIEDRQATVPPPTDVEAGTTLIGVLEQAAEGEGQPGEWMLTGTEQGDVKVDLTNVTEDVNSLEGSRVLVTGELVERSGLEGDATQVLIAERIEAA